MAGRWCKGFSQWLIRFDVLWVVPIIEDASDVAWHGVSGQSAVQVWWGGGSVVDGPIKVGELSISLVYEGLVKLAW